MQDKPYRLGAVAYIYRPSDKKILLVQLVDYEDDEWNLPGGGREADESAEENIVREIKEELGWSADQFVVERHTAEPLRYDFPASFAASGHLKAQTFRGQQKDQFLIRFVGADPYAITLQAEELKDVIWCPIDGLDKYLKFPGQWQSAIAALQELDLS